MLKNTPSENAHDISPAQEAATSSSLKQQLLNLVQDIKQWFGLTDVEIAPLIGRDRQYLWYLRTDRGLHSLPLSDEQLRGEIGMLQLVINTIDSGKRKPRSFPLSRDMLQKIITELSHEGHIGEERIAREIGMSAKKLHSLLTDPTIERIEYPYIEALETLGKKIKTHMLDTHEDVGEIINGGAEKAAAYHICIEDMAQWEFPEVLFSMHYGDARSKVQELLAYGYKNDMLDAKGRPYIECKPPIMRDFKSQYIARRLKHAQGSITHMAEEIGMSREGCYILLENALIPWLGFDSTIASALIAPESPETELSKDSFNLNAPAHRARNSVFIRIAELTAHRQPARNPRHRDAKGFQNFQQI